MVVFSILMPLSLSQAYQTTMPKNYNRDEAMPFIDPSVPLKTSITQEIRQRIVDGRYALGQRLSENILAREMRSSRAPVHDALMTLKAEGLVHVYPQRGSFVFNPTPQEKVSLYDVSGVYEMGALFLAFERGTEELCRILEEAMRQGEAALEEDNMPSWARADRIFHESIVEFSANTFLMEAYRAIIPRIAALVYRLPYSKIRMQRSMTQHHGIVDQIRRGNFEESATLLRANNLSLSS